MKRTQVIDLLTTIRGTFVSFFSIIMFVALAVAIYLGISWSGRALETSGEEAFDEGRFHDIEILSLYGLTDDDAAELRKVEGVSDVETAQVTFETARIGKEAYTTRIASLTERIDTLLVVEGTLPQEQDEIALEGLWARRNEVKVGDVVHIEGYEDADGLVSPYLNVNEFTVTALVENPAFTSNSSSAWGASPSGTGTINALAWAPLSSFNEETYEGGSTLVTVRSDDLRGMSTFDEDYQNASRAFAERIKQLGETQAVLRQDDLVSQAQEQVDEAKGQRDELAADISEGEDALADAETSLADAKQKLEDGEAELATKKAEYEDQKASGRQKLDDGLAQLNEAQATYDEAREELDAAWIQYYDASNQLDEKQAQVDPAVAAYDEARAELDARQAEYEEALAELDAQEAALDPATPGYEELLAALVAARAELIAQKPTLDAAEAELESKKAELDEGLATLEAARAELNEKGSALEEAEAELESKKAELDEGWATYYDGEATYAEEVADAETQIAEARTKLDELSDTIETNEKKLDEKRTKLEDAKDNLAGLDNVIPELEGYRDSLKENGNTWNVLTRAMNGGVVSLENFIGIAQRLCTSMASLFVLVGLFVCYSAISRLVLEMSQQIGVKKALGMRAREVTASFLLYAGAAVVVGAVLGVVGAVFVVERIIVPVLSSSFFMKTDAWWSPLFALAFCTVEFALILASAWLACHSVLSHHAVELLAGAAAPTTKERFFERWGVWQRLPLYQQTTVNNLLNDRRRVIGTLVGVAGCTALIVSAITLNDDVVAGLDYQYADVYHYDTIVRVNTDKRKALGRTETIVEELGCPNATRVGTRTVTLDLPDDTTVAATLTVPADNEDFTKLITLTSVMGETAGTQVVPDASGILIPNAYAEHYDVKPGDTLHVRTGDGAAYDLPVAGIYRHYLAGHQFIMDADLYRTVFGMDMTYDKLLVDTDGAGYDAVKEALTGKDYVESVSDDHQSQTTLFNSFRKVSRIVVLVYLALSFAMAVVVLLNLNVMFVEEKRRDLITLMVCGYTVADAKRYIWRDNAVLTVMGILLGILVGMGAGWYAVVSMEIPSMSLVKEPVLRACLIGAIVSAILSTAMTLISLRRVAHLKLSDINRM